ncbi:MAG TPA: AAC(3) family N-acetyltransferase [Bacteroidales bacterium]|nr:AAC(3) family N-acetyltransferase [Bacteroidales bacterium]
MPVQEYIPFREIPARLNISEGETVLLTSDILRLAVKARSKEKDFSADAFIDAFINTLGVNGTLLIPAYNFDLESGDTYSIKDTIPMTGSLAVAAMNRPDFIRTANPLHSFLVRGKYAGELAAMQNVSSFGPDSPFAWMKGKDTLMVFAGTSPFEAMTFTHFVEESLKVGYRKFRKIKLRYTDEQGITKELAFPIYAKKPGYTMMLDRLEDKLTEEILHRYQINGVPFYAIRCSDAFRVISRDIAENHAASISGFSPKLYIRDIIKGAVQRFNIFRTTYGKIRSGKRIS